MAAVNPPAFWVTAQTLDPLAEVDLVRLNDTLAKGYPESATPSPTVVGASGTDTVKATTTRSKK